MSTTMQESFTREVTLKDLIYIMNLIDTRNRYIHERGYSTSNTSHEHYNTAIKNVNKNICEILNIPTCM